MIVFDNGADCTLGIATDIDDSVPNACAILSPTEVMESEFWELLDEWMFVSISEEGDEEDDN